MAWNDNIANWFNASGGGPGAGSFLGQFFGGGAMSQGAFNALGQGVGDVFSAMGSEAEASAYQEAATLAQNNEQIAKASGAIQEQQLTEKLNQVVGSQTAEEGGAGFSMNGTTAQLMMRSSYAQGARAKALLSTQTAINVNNYKEEATAYEGMANAASDAALGGFLGGALDIAGGAFGL